MSEPVAVMHLVDTLAVGGAERMAVNLVNMLPRDRYRPHICCTRHDGPLSSAVRGDVVRLTLDRTGRLDALALRRLVAHVRAHDVRVLHAHSAAVFAAVLASLLPPYPAVVWHDHYGPSLERRTAWPYRAIGWRVQQVIAVNEPLAAWARSRLRIAPRRVCYIPNFVTAAEPPRTMPLLPGVPARRVACVANIRPQKDHGTLIAAFARVVAAVPDAQLLLMGAESDAEHAAALRRAVNSAGLAAHVSWMGVRDDVAEVLRACRVGVLSSESEGLPLALLEYGTAGLASVATNVGQCADVLDQGRAGVLVPPGDAAALAAALVALLHDEPRRARLGAALRRHVEERYGSAAAMDAVTAIYDRIVAGASPAGHDGGTDGGNDGGQGASVMRNTPNVGRVDGAVAAAPPIGLGGVTGVIGRESAPPAYVPVSTGASRTRSTGRTS